MNTAFGGKKLKILQALFFPPEQPGGVSSMVPYIQEYFVAQGWEMDLFYLPKRLREKGKAGIEFVTFDWKAFAGAPIVAKYMQTMRDYEWWTRMRLKQTYDLIHAHHPIAGLIMKRLFPDTPVYITIHSSFERELILNGRVREGGSEQQFLTSLYRELERAQPLVDGSSS